MKALGLGIVALVIAFGALTVWAVDVVEAACRHLEKR